jgi:hypothetical protein
MAEFMSSDPVPALRSAAALRMAKPRRVNDWMASNSGVDSRTEHPPSDHCDRDTPSAATRETEAMTDHATPSPVSGLSANSGTGEGRIFAGVLVPIGGPTNVGSDHSHAKALASEKPEGNERY